MLPDGAIDPSHIILITYMNVNPDIFDNFFLLLFAWACWSLWEEYKYHLKNRISFGFNLKSSASWIIVQSNGRAKSANGVNLNVKHQNRILYTWYSRSVLGWVVKSFCDLIFHMFMWLPVSVLIPLFWCSNYLRILLILLRDFPYLIFALFSTSYRVDKQIS